MGCILQVKQDDGIRPNTSMEVLAKLKPAFKQGGSTTAGRDGIKNVYICFLNVIHHAVKLRKAAPFFLRLMNFL